MDDGRFDQLARLVARGASRRTILKGFLGLGAALRLSDVDARTLGTRPTLSPPPAPTTRPPTTTTPAPCPGQEQCPNSTLCCPPGSCARSGNQAICCDGENGRGSVVCGLECCDSELECCDQECCRAGSVCLSRVFENGSSNAEEVCCPSDQTCDGRCCPGVCFTPDGASVSGFDRSCCPVAEQLCDGRCCEGTCYTPLGITATGQERSCCGETDALCPGDGTFAGSALCCAGDTPVCCQRHDGTPLCLTASCPDSAPDCCGPTLEDCVDLNNDAGNCGACGAVCDPGFACVDGRCVCIEDSVCPRVDACTPGQCIEGTCRTTSSCPDGQSCCGQGEDAACCTAAECIVGVCCTGPGDSPCGNVCCPTQCCHNASGPVCVSDGVTCCDDDSDCTAFRMCEDANYPPAHRDGYCAQSGTCGFTDPVTCNAATVCERNTCTHQGGCGTEILPDGTVVDGGVCCNSGQFIAGGACCDGSPCAAPDACTPAGTCMNNRCSMQSACRNISNECLRASCNETSGGCEYEDACPFGMGNRSSGSLCDFTCQCSGGVCGADAFPSTIFTCRSGGGGSRVARFCPL